MRQYVLTAINKFSQNLILSMLALFPIEIMPLKWGKFQNPRITTHDLSTFPFEPAFEVTFGWFCWFVCGLCRLGVEEVVQLFGVRLTPHNLRKLFQGAVTQRRQTLHSVHDQTVVFSIDTWHLQQKILDRKTDFSKESIKCMNIL